MLLPLLLITAVGAVVAQDSNSSSPAQPTVNTSLGKISGLLCPSSPAAGNNTASPATTPYTQYRGIPYAVPPTGQLRWAAPQPIAANYPNGLLNATQLGAPCFQPSIMGYAPPNQSEDCLVLNVFAPAQATPGSPLPVRVFFHGGDYQLGSASEVYNGCAAGADTNAIIVVPQYRLGALGFLAHRAVGTGNYGLMDQQLALRWVQANIASFGGDPHKVGIYGESAGGSSALLHMVAANSSGLFNSVVSESGPSSWELRPLENAHILADNLAARVNCTGDSAATCLRNAAAADLVAASPVDSALGATNFRYADIMRPGRTLLTPVFDGSFFPKQPSDVFTQGTYANVSLLAGSNHDEGRLFVPSPQNVTFDNYTSFIADSVLVELIPNVTAMYPASPNTPMSAYFAVVQMITDRSYGCPARRVLRAFHSHASPAYSYLFSQTLSCAFYPKAPPKFLKASHYAEVNLVFEHFSGLTMDDPTCTLSPAEQKLAHDMNAAWTAMITAGNPAVPGIPSWPQYPAYAELNATSPAPFGDSDAQTQQWEARCAIWDAVPITWSVDSGNGNGNTTVPGTSAATQQHATWATMLLSLAAVLVLL
ncbi:hypothetical protein RI367_008095 [Sorochytrium milnesiophthora]